MSTMQELHERISDLIDQRKYNKAAKLFLSETKIKLSIKFKDYASMPWDDKGKKRNIFRVKLKKEDGTKYAFDFGDSIVNSAKHSTKIPNSYDALSCLTVFYFEEVKDVVNDLGANMAQSMLIFKEEKKMRAFFTEDEIQALNSIN